MRAAKALASLRTCADPPEYLNSSMQKVPKSHLLAHLHTCNDVTADQFDPGLFLAYRSDTCLTKIMMISSTILERCQNGIMSVLPR